MKVIFLDFDGVINNWDHFETIDINSVMILKYIQEQTNSFIVATTSQKYSFQKNHNTSFKETNFYKICSLLKKLGITINDVTPLVKGNRFLEIKEYLNSHKNITEYLILDDEYIDDSLKDHQVLIDLYNGLQKEHIIPSINILNGILGFYPKDYDTKMSKEEVLVRINNYHLTKKINNN